MKQYLHVVLDHMKSQYPEERYAVGIIRDFWFDFEHNSLPDDVDAVYSDMNIMDEAVVLKALSEWIIEQESGASEK